jgi:hypothetical protein
VETTTADTRPGDLDGIIRMLMAIDAKLDRLLGEEDEEDAPEDES